MSTARSRATQKYHAKVYDQLIIQVKKGDKAYIKSVAAEYGYTLAGFCREAINDKIRSLSIDDKRRVLIKVLNMIIARKKAIQYHDFCSGIKYLIESVEQSQEPQEGHNNSSADNDIIH